MRALGTTRIRVVRVAGGAVGSVEILTVTQHRFRRWFRRYLVYSIDAVEDPPPGVVYIVAEDRSADAGTLV